MQNMWKYLEICRTKQNEDKIIFGEKKKETHRYVGASVTEDGKYLIIEEL